MKTSVEVKLHLSTIIDLINHLYIFGGFVRNIDIDFADSFKAARKMSDCGIWWRFFYGVVFHTALHQITERVANVTNVKLNGEVIVLSEIEANNLLPYLSIVRELLSIWRNTEEDEDVRRRKIASMFPIEITRIIMPIHSEQIKSQFYEEIPKPSGGGIGDFFSYLSECPIPGNGQRLLTLQEAFAYWGWIDNVKAFRTFCREEGGKNIRLIRMKQAIKFYQLVQLAQERMNVDLEMISLSFNNQSLSTIQEIDFDFTALVADSLGQYPIFDYYSAEIFITHKSFGDVIRTVKSLFPPNVPGELTFHHISVILKATAINIDNHRGLLDKERLINLNSCSGNPEHICAMLAETINKLECESSRNLHNPMVTIQMLSDLGLRKFLLKEPTHLCSLLNQFTPFLHLTKYLTDTIATKDSKSCYSSAGLNFLIELAQSSIIL